MSRRMSVSMTLEAVRERRKTVTRRHVSTWANLRAGDRLTLIEKGMGLPKGSTQVVVAEVEIVDVRVEPLVEVWNERGALEAEGIDDMSPNLFAYWWAEGHGYRGCESPEDLAGIECRRIEWRYLSE